VTLKDFDRDCVFNASDNASLHDLIEVAVDRRQFLRAGLAHKQVIAVRVEVVHVDARLRPVQPRAHFRREDFVPQPLRRAHVGGRARELDAELAFALLEPGFASLHAWALLARCFALIACAATLGTSVYARVTRP
jgi:hypothetical protein